MSGFTFNNVIRVDHLQHSALIGGAVAALSTTIAPSRSSVRDGVIVGFAAYAYMVNYGHPELDFLSFSPSETAEKTGNATFM